MFIPKEMKLNRFKEVSLPSARDFFGITQGQIPNSSQYTGDEPAPMPANKVDSINDFIDYAEQMQREESLKGE